MMQFMKSVTRQIGPLCMVFWLGGCGLFSPALSSSAFQVSRQPAPLNYRQLASNSIARLPEPSKFYNSQISELRPATTMVLADWYACVRYGAGGSLIVVYLGGAVQDIRTSIGPDRCNEAEGFSALPRPELPSQ